FKALIYNMMKFTFMHDYHMNIKIRNTLYYSIYDFHMLFSKDKVYPAPDSFYSTQEIHKSIDALDDEYRISFTLFLEGYKYKEIAEELDLPLGTVKSRIFFTRKKLEKSLSEFSNN